MTVDRATELWDETKFASIPMTHGSKETYAAPMVTNWWAEVQAAADPIAYRIFSAHPLATAEGLQAEMYMRLPHLDRVLPLHQLGEPITYVWYPDRVVRTMRYEGLKFTSVMTLAAGRNALLIEFNVANVGATSCSGLKLFLKLLSGVQQLESSSSWNTVALPSAATRADTGRNAFVFVGVGPACSVQGTDQPSLSYRSSVAYAEWLGDANLGGIVADRVRTPSVVAGFEYRVDLPPNSTWRIRYVNALANDVEPALALYDDSQAHFDERVAEARAAWESEIVAAFTPGNHRFSGNLPTLAGVDHSVQRVYRTAALTLLFMKRTGPGSRFGTVYKSISPRSGSTFWLWETQQAAGGLARLDPAALQTMAEWWMQTDIHNCWGTDYITGDPLGPWYSVNDYALFSICYDYLRHTGDLDWLRKRVAGATVLQHLQRCAGHWRELSSGDYLADYGEANNLLECVKTYAHKVAALNAANAWMNLTLAKIEERLGDSASARQRCAEARSISEAVIRLYRSGGYFACRQPDGSEVEVQHCYDFGVVMAALFDDLGSKRRSEMISFFKRKLQTPSWMRALAADDPAAAFSRRTDHMATGAYASWPCYALMALCRCGDLESALYWIGAGNESGGIAGVAKQGPFGQGTFHGGEGSLLEGGAARKAPDSPPHYEEWIDVAGGAYINVILEGLFGVRSTLFEDVGASGSLLAHLPDARFYGLRHHDQIYDYSKGKLEKRGDR